MHGELVDEDREVERWLTRLRLTGVVLPVAFVLALPLLADTVLEPRWPGHGHLLASLLAAWMVLFFALAMFFVIERGYRKVLALQERALRAERHGAALEERDRIAREMHDSVAQVLSLAHLRLTVLQASPELVDAPLARAELAELAALCQESVRDVRETIGGLRTSTRPGTGFVDALSSHLAAFERASGIGCELRCEPADAVLPEEHSLQLSRVVQEALTNVRKHSGARTARVSVAVDEHRVRIVVSDDGHGFVVSDDGRGFLVPGDDGSALAAEGHYGLSSMRERVAQLGGHLQLVSTPGEGTSVLVDVPLPPTPPSLRTK